MTTALKNPMRKDKADLRRHIGQFLIDEDDILIVYSHERARLFRQFSRSQVFTPQSRAFLNGRKPARIFRADLGISEQAWQIIAETERMHLIHGTELYRLYEDGTVIRT